MSYSYAGPGVPARAASAADEIAVLHAHHYLRLVRLAVALTDQREVAEEVVQDAFVATLRRWDRIRNQEAAEAYLRRAVVNGARDRLRARRVRRSVVLPEPEPALGPEHEVLALEQQRQLLQALSGLPRRQREVLVLRYFGGLSERATADAVGLSVGGVKSSAHRGLAALRKQLDEAVLDEGGINQ